MEKNYNFLGKQMKIEELGIYILTLFCILGTFMPYYTISAFGASQSINYVSRDGIFVIALCIAACVCMWLKKHMLTLIFSIIAIAIVLFDFGSDYDVLEGVGKHDIGAYICLISTAIVAICSLINFLRNKNGSESIDNGLSSIAKKTKEVTNAVLKSGSEINTVKNIIVCPECNKHYSKEMNFCPECGTPKPKEEKIFCSECNTELDKDSKYCPKCGKQAPEAKVELPTVCKNCGAELKEGATFCGKCGSKIGE